MRARRRFTPTLDCLQFRVVPSTIVPAPTAASVVVASDETGSPGDVPDGDEYYPYIMTPPTPTTSPGPVSPVTALC